LKWAEKSLNKVIPFPRRNQQKNYFFLAAMRLYFYSRKFAPHPHPTSAFPRLPKTVKCRMYSDNSLSFPKTNENTTR